MNNFGVIAEGVEVPRDSPGVSSALSKLRFRYVPAGQEDSETFHCYKNLDNGNVLMPRYYGMGLCNAGLLPANWRGSGVRTNTMPRYDKRPTMRDEQAPWVADVLNYFARADTADLVAAAPTGKGKTVMAINIAARMGRATLIVVDQENLKDQWIERLEQHLGIDPDDVGIFQGKVNKQSKCGFTIAMVQSLYSKEHTVKTWQQQFGLTIFDECHSIGAPQFSQVLFMISSEFRLGISATPDRRDAFDKVLKWHLGPTQVRMLAEHDRSTVRVVENYTTTSWYANISPKAGRYVNELAEDPVRNWSIVEIIRWFSEHKRRALILSDRIGHLEALVAACRAAGIDDFFGVYTRYSSRWAYAKDDTPQRHPVGWVRGTEYTPVCLQQVRARRKKTELEYQMDCQIIFATYAMFGKGVDLPDLDAGLDATPRTFVVQIHGRILRKQEGKVTPIWVTIRDVNSQRAEHQFKTRIKELERSNAEVYQWIPGKGAVKQTNAATLSDEADRRSRMLKSCRIVTSSDGRNTLEIPSMLRSSAGGSGITTDKRAVKRSVGSRVSREANSSSAPRARRSRSGATTPTQAAAPTPSSSRSGKRRRRSADPS